MALLKYLDPTQYRYTPDVGTHPKNFVVKCGVCGADTEFTGDQCGARSFAEAMSGRTGNYDCYECPHRNDHWHKRATELRVWMASVPSQAIRDVVEEEVQNILENKCT